MAPPTLPLFTISLNHPLSAPAAIDGMSAGRSKRAAAGRAVGHGRQPQQPQPLYTATTTATPPAPITTSRTAADVLTAQYVPLDMGIFTPLSPFNDINHLAAVFNSDGLGGDNGITIGAPADGGAPRDRDGRGAKKRARVSDGSESESEGDINAADGAPSVSYAAALPAFPYWPTSANDPAHHAAHHVGMGMGVGVGMGVGELTPPPSPWPPASTDASPLAAGTPPVNGDLATMSALSPDVMFALLAANAVANAAANAAADAAANAAAYPNPSAVYHHAAAPPPPPDLSVLLHKQSRALAKANAKAKAAAAECALAKREDAQKTAALRKQLAACKTRLDKERSDNFFLTSDCLPLMADVRGLEAQVKGLEVRVWVAETKASAREEVQGEQGVKMELEEEVKVELEARARAQDVKMEDGEDAKVKLEQEEAEVKVKVEVM